MKTALKKLVKILFVFIVITALAVPQSVFAQDDVTTPEPSSAEVVVTDVPTEIATDVATDVPTVVATDVPTEVVTEVETDALTEVPTVVITDEPVVIEETLADVVDILDTEGLVLFDENGNPLPMASEQAADAIMVADPWFVDPADPTGMTVIAYQSNCTGWSVPAGYTGGACNVSTTPVQTAIDNAPTGSTVFLGAGIFVEQISITKNLTLQGSVGTIIQSPTSLVTKFTTSVTQKPIIYVNGADVIIDSITVDGANLGSDANYRFSGIAYYNAGGTISNSTIMNIKADPLSGSQHGIGIYAYNTDGVLRTLNIINNNIIGFQKTGIALAGEGLTVNVDGNTVTGAGPTDVTAQNGIQVSYGATGSVTNNTVKDIWYSGNGWSATGILLYDSDGTVEVSGNTVTNSQSGLNAYLSPMIAEGNNIDGSEWGIISDIALYDKYGNFIGYGDETDSQILNNIIQNSHNEAIYNNDASLFVRENIFLNNGYGIGNDAETAIMAQYNYWGCDLGPDPLNLAPCNTYYGLVNFNPWLIDPDADGVFQSSNGDGAYVDNCPTTYNPDQEDRNGNGIGNACEPVVNYDNDYDGVQSFEDNCPTVSNSDQKDTDKDGIGDACDSTPKGVFKPLLVPVTGGAGSFSTFDCNSTTTLRLPSSDMVVASSDFCNMQGELTEQLKEVLPAELPAGGPAFTFGMNLTVLDNLSPLTSITDPGRLTFSFSIPADLREKEFTIYFWDPTLKEGAGDWVELPAYTEKEDGTPVITSLHTEEKTELRMILEGVQKTEMNRVEFVTNFPGMFILAVK